MPHDQLEKEINGSANSDTTAAPATGFSLKRKEVKRFLSAIAILMLIIIVVMVKVMIGGAIDEYHLPLSQWTAEMFVTQCFMIAVYSLVFTGLLSIPLWYWFLGEDDNQQG